MPKKAILFSAGEYLSSRVPINDLSGVRYDIAAIEKRLIQIGFDVEKKENAYKKDYIPILFKAVENSPSDAIHIVYFSGHGGHYNGKNYILPSDFGSRFDISHDIEDAGVRIEDIISVFKNKGRLILILDACRGDVGLSKGYFAEMTSAENVYIAYGTMFKYSSMGIENALSRFTEAICDEILTPNIDVDTLFTQVRQNIYTKYYMQIPPSVNALIDKVVLYSELDYDITDKQVYDFIKKYGDKYNDKYGYFQGDDLIFIDAAQYFNIGLLDAIWKFKKVDAKIYKDKGVKVPQLSEPEIKLVSFLRFNRSKRFFSHDECHTWYYNGRQIRMGEIPPLPPSMQRKLPEMGKEYLVNFEIEKQDKSLIIKTNLPEGSKLLVWYNKIKLSKELEVSNGVLRIEEADGINKVVIDSVVFISDPIKQQIIGDKGRNLIGESVKYHPIEGNKINCVFEL